MKISFDDFCHEHTYAWIVPGYTSQTYLKIFNKNNGQVNDYGEQQPEEILKNQIDERNALTVKLTG